MKTKRFGLLLAAAAIAATPVVALAQEHGDWQGRRGDGGRPVGVGRGEGQRGPRPEAPSPAPVAQPAPQRAPQAGAQFSPGQSDPGRQARAAEYARQRDRQGQGFNGNWSRADANGRRDFDRSVPPLQSQPGRPQRYDDNRGYAGRDNRGFSGGGNRNDDHHRTIEVGRDNRGFDNRGFDNRGFDNRGFDNRRGWQRSWRNDGRYDWQGWRSRNRGLYHTPRYIPPRGYGFGYRLFSPGFRLDPFFYDQGYWLADPWEYRLPPAYGPYRWVRYYNDVLLVDITRGIVVDVIRDFFW